MEEKKENCQNNHCCCMASAVKKAALYVSLAGVAIAGIWAGTRMREINLHNERLNRRLEMKNKIEI